MAKDPYQESGDSASCGHPNQQAHMRDDGTGKQKMVVSCPGCGMEWS